MKITTKAKLCDVVKLQYGSKGVEGDVHITDSDKLVIPKKSGERAEAVDRYTKLYIYEVLYISMLCIYLCIYLLKVLLIRNRPLCSSGPQIC